MTRTDLRLLTAAEVAETLRLNRQVVLRKLQSGEIEAYKIGKDWRVEERALRAWLEARSNRRSPEERASEPFFDRLGRLKSIPAKRSVRLPILRRLVAEFGPDRSYTEKEVNAVLRRFHEDVCTLRREFIINKLMVRKDGVYHRTTP